MVTRNAYIISGALHLALLGLMFLFANGPSTSIRQFHKYQPVRLVALPGRPGTPQVKPRAETKPPPAKPKEESKPKEETKPAVKSQDKPKTVATKSGTGESAKTNKETASSTEEAGEGGQGGVRLDGASFPYPYYLNSIQIKILANFKPVIKARDAEGLKTVVFFVIDRSGRISDVKLESKSGHFLFDQEAQRAVMRSNPLPALPPAFGSDRLGVHFEFVASQ